MKSLLWFSVVLVTLYGLYLELFSGVDAVRVFYDWGVFRWVLGVLLHGLLYALRTRCPERLP